MRSGSHVIDRPPAAPMSEGGGGGGWSWLLTASGVIEAQLVRGLLETAGIVPVALDGRDPSPGAWMFLAGNVNAPVRVFVPTSLLDDARLALLETGFLPGAPEAPREKRAVRRFGPARLVVAGLVALALSWVVFSTACRDAGMC